MSTGRPRTGSGTGHRGGHRTEAFGSNRRVVAAASAVSRESNTIHLVTEIDVSRPRRLIARHRDRTGERLSLTGYVVTCLGRAVTEFPEFNSFRKGDRLVILDDVTVNVLFEREIDGERVPDAVAVHHADTKTYRQIADEIRSVQAQRADHVGSGSGMAWIRFIPGFLLCAFVRLASRNTLMKKRFGVVAVTSVGMFGSGAMWLVPLSSATVAVAVGSIVKRLVLVDGRAEEREHLCLTVSFDHDIVDGAPAARFVSALARRLSVGDEVRTAI